MSFVDERRCSKHFRDDNQNFGQKESFSLLKGDELFSSSFFLMLKYIWVFFKTGCKFKSNYVY